MPVCRRNRPARKTELRRVKRASQLKPANCPFYENGDRVIQNRKPHTIRKIFKVAEYTQKSFDLAEFEKLYESGLSDKKIAEELKVDWSTISRYRRSIGNPSNFDPKKKRKEKA